MQKACLSSVGRSRRPYSAMEYVETLPRLRHQGRRAVGKISSYIKDSGENESQDVSVDLDGEALRGCWGMPHIEGRLLREVKICFSVYS